MPTRKTAQNHQGQNLLLVKPVSNFITFFCWNVLFYTAGSGSAFRMRMRIQKGKWISIAPACKYCTYCKGSVQYCTAKFSTILTVLFIGLSSPVPVLYYTFGWETSNTFLGKGIAVVGSFRSRKRISKIFFHFSLVKLIILSLHREKINISNDFLKS